MRRMKVVDSPPGITRPSSPASCSGLRTSVTSAPSARSTFACSRKFPCTARTPIRSGSMPQIVSGPCGLGPAQLRGRAQPAEAGRLVDADDERGAPDDPERAEGCERPGEERRAVVAPRDPEADPRSEGGAAGGGTGEGPDTRREAGNAEGPP